ncbi:MAG: AmmeMemoRadiSam system radical SAM enzyme [Syntrophobacteraceae bacterium]|nr:AmmeMemoRadiSam system radical SAM enzyme [Syntrophobacteraceae bacterium]
MLADRRAVGAVETEPLQFLRHQRDGHNRLCAVEHTRCQSLAARTRDAQLYDRYNGTWVRCHACGHECPIPDGAAGVCKVRFNRQGVLMAPWGYVAGAQADPIEKKPFFHVLPATSSFSIATAGCNLHCKFCQNWEISQARPDETYNHDLPPEEVVKQAARYQCRSIASTYVEPTIFIEYMLDIGRLAKEQTILKVIHSNGFINPAPLKDLCKVLDAACIDLKGFTDDFYREVTGGSLKPVLETLKQLKENGVHTELVNLIVPTKNDSMDEIRSMCRWIRTELGPDVPLHFSRFYPLYKLKSLPPTPLATLEAAWKTALDEGLHYVYIGNVPGHPAENTTCPSCRKTVIEREGYQIRNVSLLEGRCQFCGHPIRGIWAV